MRTLILAALIAALTACRGEPVPRDYQNAPPDVTHPPDSKKDAPSTGATGQASPEPSEGVEGPAAVSTETSTTTMSDTPPVTTTT